MRTESVTVEWDRHAGAWRLTGSPAGPAGVAEVSLGAVSWRVDWMSPSHLVEALVIVPGDSPDADVPPAAIETVAALCGSDAARALAARPQQRPLTASLDPRRSSTRALAGRLALVLELSSAEPAPGWWDVEGAAAALALGSAGPGQDLTDELVQRALELVDAIPAPVLAALAASQLADPLAAVLLRAGVPEAELHGALRLSAAEVDRRFDRLVGPADLAPATRPARLPAPTFRRSGTFDRRDRRAVEWIDTPVQALRDAMWHLDADAVHVVVRTMGALPADACVRLVDARGRAPIVLDRATPVASGTIDGLTTSVCELDARAADGTVRIELVGSDDDAPVPVPLRARRHATSLARSAAHLERRADAELRSATVRADDALRVAARQWSRAVDAWERAGATEQAEASARHRRRLEELTREATAPTSSFGASQGDSPGASSDACVAGWTESALVVAADLLDDASVVDAVRRSAGEWSSLAALAESVGDLPVAARFRADQARASDGVARDVAVRVLLHHHRRLGTRPPRDLEPSGAPDG